jgi:hypothetical protein
VRVFEARTLWPTVKTYTLKLGKYDMLCSNLSLTLLAYFSKVSLENNLRSYLNVMIPTKR